MNILTILPEILKAYASVSEYHTQRQEFLEYNGKIRDVLLFHPEPLKNLQQPLLPPRFFHAIDLLDAGTSWVSP